MLISTTNGPSHSILPRRSAGKERREASGGVGFGAEGGVAGVAEPGLANKSLANNMVRCETGSLGIGEIDACGYAGIKGSELSVDRLSPFFFFSLFLFLI